MAIIFDLKKAKAATRLRILNTGKKLLNTFENIQTIIVKKAPGTFGSREYGDFSFFLFMAEDRNCPKKISTLATEDPNFKRYEYRMELVPRYDIGMGYEKTAYSSSADQPIFPWKSCKHEKRRYSTFLLNNLRRYTHVESNIAEIFIIHSPVMKRDNPRFYQNYLTQQLETGYLMYNDSLKTEVFLP